MLLPAVITSALLSPCPVLVDAPFDVGPDALLGTSIAIDGDLAVVGAPIDTGLAWASGAVYVYRWTGDSWIHEARLIAEDGALADMLGVDVDVWGDRIIAGAWFDDDAGSNSGAAYLFERDNEGNWSQAGKLVAPDAAAEDAFGRTVALGQGFCAVGAPLDDDLGQTSGSIRVFTETADGTWVFDAKLLHPGGSSGDELGLSLAVDGDRILGGAPWAHEGRGEIHMWERLGAGQQWNHTWYMTMATYGSPGDFFGFSVALEGNRMVAGAYGDDIAGPDAGSIWTMDRVFDGWAFEQHLPPQPQGGAQFGISVALSGDRLLVGSNFGLNGTVPSGSVDVLARDGASWVPSGVLSAPDPVAEAEFGWSVDVAGDLAMVGALTQPPNGAVYAWRGLVEPCGCASDINGDGVVGVDDVLAVLAGWGSTGDGDVDGSGTIDVDDLLIVIASWGVCP